VNLTVLGPRVFVRPEKLPEQSETGLHLVHDRQNSTMKGTVVALGNGPEFVQRAVRGVLADVQERLKGLRAEQAVVEVRDAYRAEHTVEVGERVLFSPDAGQELIFEKDVLVCLLEDDILAVIE